MAETVRVEKQSGVSVRAFSRGEESALLDILKDAFGSLADVPRTRAALSSRRFDADGCFVAEENEAPIGWVAATRLPRDNWLVIRYLSIRRSRFQTAIAERLLARAITYVESKGPEFLRATTPAVRPYVDSRLETEEVLDETMDSASSLFVRALSPYWDWRTEEEGGNATVAESFKEDRSRGARWILASLNKESVGLVGIIPDFYEPGVAWFRGAFVLPEHRGKGIGSALMSENSKFAKILEQRKMVVYTFSYLDSLAPGALLYLKTGGKIEAEYLQLARL